MDPYLGVLRTEGGSLISLHLSFFIQKSRHNYIWHSGFFFLIRNDIYLAQCLETATPLRKGCYCYYCYPCLRVCVIDLGCEFES